MFECFVSHFEHNVLEAAHCKTCKKYKLLSSPLDAMVQKPPNKNECSINLLFSIYQRYGQDRISLHKKV